MSQFKHELINEQGKQWNTHINRSNYFYSNFLCVSNFIWTIKWEHILNLHWAEDLESKVHDAIPEKSLRWDQPNFTWYSNLNFNVKRECQSYKAPFLPKLRIAVQCFASNTAVEKLKATVISMLFFVFVSALIFMII